MRKAAIKNRICAAMLLLVLLISGCTIVNETTPALEPSNQMPPAVTEGVEREGSFTAKLYFLAEYELRFAPQMREITYTGNISQAQAAVEALIQGPSGGVLRPSLPENISLDRVELSSSVCNIYLLSSYLPSASEWFVARAALAATVYEAEGVESINLYLNGMEPGMNRRPLGAISPIAEDLDTYVASMQQEFDTWYSEVDTEAGSFEARTATLYFTDFNGALLLGKNSPVNYDRSEDYAGITALLVSKLRDGDASLEPVIPPGAILSQQPGVTPVEQIRAELFPPSEESDMPHPQDPESLSGKSVISLWFERPVYDYDARIFTGALTLTITGYIPNVEGVIVYVREEDGSYQNLAGDKIYFTRADFRNMVGVSLYLPFPDSEGSILHRVPRTVSGRSAYDPLVRLSELFKGPADPGVNYPLFTAEDVLGAYVTGNLAVINWKSGFSQKLSALIESDAFSIPKDRRERLFIYSVVNAITEIPGIERVWMLEDGEKLGAVKDIYLGNALLRNPGIMIDD